MRLRARSLLPRSWQRYSAAQLLSPCSLQAWNETKDARHFLLTDSDGRKFSLRVQLRNRHIIFVLQQLSHTFTCGLCRCRY